MVAETSNALRVEVAVRVARKLARHAGASPMRLGDRVGGGKLGLYRSCAAQAVSGPVMQFVSTLTCPSCGHRSIETMPTDACQFYYECKACGAMLRPKAGDCCVFCSFGDVPCPPIQEARRGERAAGCCSGPAVT